MSQVAGEEENEGKLMENEEIRGNINKNSYEDQFMSFVSVSFSSVQFWNSFSTLFLILLDT